MMRPTTDVSNDYIDAARALAYVAFRSEIHPYAMIEQLGILSNMLHDALCRTKGCNGCWGIQSSTRELRRALQTL